MCVQNLKSVALPVPEIIGVPKKSGQSWTPWICPRSLSPKKSYAYRTDYLSLCTRFLAILDCSFEWGLRTPLCWGKGGRTGSWKAPFERTLVSSYSNFSSIFTRFRDIAAFVLQHATFPYRTSTLPRISPCSPANRWIAFSLQRAKVLG